MFGLHKLHGANQRERGALRRDRVAKAESDGSEIVHLVKDPTLRLAVTNQTHCTPASATRQR